MNKELLVIHIYLWKYGMLAPIWSFIRGTFMSKLKLGLCSSLITTGKVNLKKIIILCSRGGYEVVNS